MVEQSSKDVVVQVHMHCRGCADKVKECLRGFDGVEGVEIDRENHRVIARGDNVDPLMVLERIRKKHYSNAELISPKIVAKAKEPEPPPEEPKQIPIKMFVLEMPMHCQKCATDIRTSLFEIEGVLTVNPNMEQGTVVVKGAVEAATMVEHIRRKLRKHAVVRSEEAVVPDDKKKKKKKNKKNEKKEEEETEKEKETTTMVVFHSLPQYSFCPCEAFNDENVHSCLIM